MLEPISQLLILQHTDQHIHEVTQALDQLPQEKFSCEQALLAADHKLESVLVQQQGMEKEIKKIEGLIEAKRAQVARYQIQQMETRKNDAYAAFNHEIALAQQSISLLEDQQLALMDKIDLLKPDIELAREIHAIEHKRLHSILATFDGRFENLLARKHSLQKERPHLTLHIEEEMLDRYERLFKSKNGLAVAALEHGVCTGCHMQMTMQTILSAKAEKEMITCPQCGRYLHTEED